MLDGSSPKRSRLKLSGCVADADRLSLDSAVHAEATSSSLVLSLLWPPVFPNFLPRPKHND